MCRQSEQGNYNFLSFNMRYIHEDSEAFMPNKQIKGIKQTNKQMGIKKKKKLVRDEYMQRGTTFIDIPNIT